VATVNPVLHGGCYCGRIRYQAAGPISQESICHCTICRKTTGAPFVAWFSVPRGQFRFVQGEPSRFKSTLKGMRSFCPQCATQLTFEHADRAGYVDITTCSLDDPNAAAPKEHIFTRSRLSWIKLGDQLPEYATYPPEEHA
jgi:hypothetical protein